jgi:hypothetical protein
MLEWGYNKENTKVSLNAGMDLLGSGVGRVGGGRAKVQVSDFTQSQQLLPQCLFQSHTSTGGHLWMFYSSLVSCLQTLMLLFDEATN